MRSLTNYRTFEGKRQGVGDSDHGGTYAQVEWVTQGPRPQIGRAGLSRPSRLETSDSRGSGRGTGGHGDTGGVGAEWFLGTPALLTLYGFWV